MKFEAKPFNSAVKAESGKASLPTFAITQFRPAMTELIRSESYISYVFDKLVETLRAELTQ